MPTITKVEALDRLRTASTQLDRCSQPITSPEQDAILAADAAAQKELKDAHEAMADALGGDGEAKAVSRLQLAQSLAEMHQDRSQPVKDFVNEARRKAMTGYEVAETRLLDAKRILVMLLIDELVQGMDLEGIRFTLGQAYGMRQAYSTFCPTWPEFLASIFPAPAREDWGPEIRQAKTQLAAYFARETGKAEVAS